MNNQNPNQPHAPSHLREEFQQWLDSYEPNRLQEMDIRPVASVLDALADCGDVLPTDYCDQLEIPKGSTYAQAVEEVRQWSQASTSIERPEEVVDSWRDRQFPEHVPTGWELADHARRYLAEFFIEDIHAFLTGHYGGSHVGACYKRFDEIAELLGPVARREIVDEVEATFKEKHGDCWEAYKFLFKPGFFSDHADLKAIVRLALELPEGGWDEAEDYYSFDYIAVLRRAEDAFPGTLPCYEEFLRDLEKEWSTPGEATEVGPRIRMSGEKDNGHASDS